MKVFELYGHTIEVSDAFEQYNEFRHQYKKYADEAYEKFTKIYDKYGDLDELIKNAEGDGKRLIVQYIEKAANKFVKEYKIFNFDVEGCVNEYFENGYSDWPETIEEIADKYQEIMDNQEERDRYRTHRRKTRDRFVGYGYDVGDQLVASAKAGAANLAMGAAHGAFNLLSSGVSRLGDAVKKSSIYNDDSNKNMLARSIRISVFNIHLLVVKKSSDYGIISKSELLEIPAFNENIQNDSRAYMKNISRFSDEDLKDQCHNIIKVNPYMTELYDILFNKFKDPKGELEQLCNFFAIDIASMKKKALGNFYAKLDLSTEASAIAAKDSFMQFVNECSAEKYAKKMLNNICTKIKEFDEAARNIFGVMFDSREAANVVHAVIDYLKNCIENKDTHPLEKEAISAELAKIENAELRTRVEDDFLTNYVAAFPQDTEEEVFLLRGKIQEFFQLFPEWPNQQVHLDACDAKLSDFDRAAKTVKAKMFTCDGRESREMEVIVDTREEAALLQSKWQQLEAKYVDCVKAPTLEKVQGLVACVQDDKLHPIVRKAYDERLSMLFNNSSSYKNMAIALWKQIALFLLSLLFGLAELNTGKDIHEFIGCIFIAFCVAISIQIYKKLSLYMVIYKSGLASDKVKK